MSNSEIEKRGYDVEKYRREQEWQERGEGLAKQISEFVNGSNSVCEDAFVDKLMRDHRTLQQSTMRLIMKVIKAHAENPSNDLRNEGTKNLCQAIMNLESCLPFV